jgi:hypothetical protein
MYSNWDYQEIFIICDVTMFSIGHIEKTLREPKKDRRIEGCWKERDCSKRWNLKTWIG